MVCETSEAEIVVEHIVDQAETGKEEQKRRGERQDQPAFMGEQERQGYPRERTQQFTHLLAWSKRHEIPPFDRVGLLQKRCGHARWLVT